MDTAQKILQLLQEHAGSALSGRLMGEQLGISRTAVWKGIRKLQQTGFNIKALPRAGYLLSGCSSDLLTKDGLLSFLKPAAAAKISLQVHSSLDSTQEELARLARTGAPAGTCVAAAQQLQGRGRRGRSFFSPPGGVYLSVLLRPPALRQSDARWLTVLAALAAAQAIDRLMGADEAKARIKWLNDICLNDRKVCGILCEASMEMSTDLVDYVCIGAGFNLYAPECPIPPELHGVMGHILSRLQPNGKNRLAADFLSTLHHLLTHFNKSACAADFKARSNLIGRQVLLESQSGNLPAIVMDIDEECRLIVRFHDGTHAALQGGHIRLMSD